MILHELYFAISAKAVAPAGDLPGHRTRLWQRRDSWRAEFAAWARRWAVARAGCSDLESLRDGRLINEWAADHTMTLAGGTPILALDMYEHCLPHRLRRQCPAAYVDAFMADIDWTHRRALRRQNFRGSAGTRSRTRRRAPCSTPIPTSS